MSYIFTFDDTQEKNGCTNQNFQSSCGHVHKPRSLKWLSAPSTEIFKMKSRKYWRYTWINIEVEFIFI